MLWEHSHSEVNGKHLLLQVFNMKPLQIIIPSREDPDSPIIDLDLHLPLLCFKPEQVLQVKLTDTVKCVRD